MKICILIQWQSEVLKLERVNSRFQASRREIDEIYALLSYYTVFFLDFFILEGGTDKMCRKIGKEIPLYFNPLALELDIK